MHCRLPITIAIVALAATPLAPAQGKHNRTAKRIVDAMLQALVEMTGVPGMSAAITHKGKVIWRGNAGYRDLIRKLPVAENTTFRLASVSKAITATAAVKLGAQGKFDFAAPVQSYVQGLNPEWAPISANQLAAHISGIPHYQEVDSDRGMAHYAKVSDAVSIFSNRPLVAQPGSRYEYSSFGFTLLSAAIEARAGQPFLSYVAQHITDGLDIRADVGSPRWNDTQAYEFGDNGIRNAPEHDYSYSWGGAGFRGTATALALFGARTMDSKFLPDDARHMMWAPIRYANGEPVTERNYTMGFGWRIGRDTAGEDIVHHSGLANGARSSLVVYPNSRYSVSVLSNAEWVSSIEQTATMFVAPLKTQPNKLAPPCPLSAARYEGTFGDKPVAGKAKFTMIDGQCRGYLGTDNLVGAWFNSHFQKDATNLQLFALTADGRLGRAALVTTSGIYDFRLQVDGAYLANLGTNRTFVVRFVASASVSAPAS